MIKTRYIQYIIVAILVLVAIVLLIRPYIAGVDTYYFINNICFDVPIDAPILSEFVFSILLCNILILKAIQMILFLITLFILYKIGEIYETDKYNAWLFVLISFSSLYLIFEFFGNLEDDHLAFPMLFGSIYYFIKFVKFRSLKDYAISVFLVGISCLFWKGAVIYFVFLGVSSLYYTPYLVIAVILFNSKLISTAMSLLPNLSVMENMPIIAILYMFMSIIGIFIFKSKEEISIKIFAAFTLGLALINGKFGIHVLPFMIIGIFLYIKHIDKDEERKSKFLMFWILLGFTILIGISSILMFAPTNDTFNMIDTAVQYSEDYNIRLSNDWGLGYFIWYHTQKEPQYFGHTEEYYNYENSILITSKNLTIDQNCDILEEYDKHRIMYCGAREG